METPIQEDLSLTYKDDYMNNRGEVEIYESIDFHFLTNIEVCELKEEFNDWVNGLIEQKEKGQYTHMNIVYEESDDYHGYSHGEYYLLSKRWETPEEYKTSLVKTETKYEEDFETNLKLVMSMPKEQKNKFVIELFERDDDFSMYIK